VPVSTRTKTDVTADFRPAKKASAEELKVLGTGMATAHLSHRPASFATAAPACVLGKIL